jgi:23S rRNA (guanosine2251-2'-O)-methyltransferase
MRKLKNEELGRPSPEAFKEQAKFPVRLVLDDIRSMHNVGSAFRTADAFNVEAIHLCGITARPPHRDIEKTALGATESVVWQYHEQALEAIAQLKKEGFLIAVLEQTTGSISLDTFQPEPGKKYAFVFGNEVFGVNEALVQQADLCLEIPQYGTKHSLNVSVSVGVVLWDYVGKRVEL